MITQQKDDVDYKKIRLAMANIFDEFIKGMISFNFILQCVLVQIRYRNLSRVNENVGCKSVSRSLCLSMVYLELRE